MSVPIKQKWRIDEFDGLRGILALWVAFSHILCWCGFATLKLMSAHATTSRLWGDFVFAQGAVDTFMILSGFVITYLIHKDRQVYSKFMIGRFFRIYPVYFSCLLLGVASMFLIPDILKQSVWRDTVYFQWEQSHSACELGQPLAHFLAHLTLLFGAIPDQVLPQASATLLTPAWSISLEWQYYLVAPFLAVWVYSRTGIVVLALVCLGEFCYVHVWGNAFLPNNLALFLVGIGSYHLYANQQHWKNSKPISFALLIALGFAILASWHAVALSFWTLTFGCLFLSEKDGDAYSVWFRRFRRALLHPALQLLGRISYPLYLVHWPIIIFLMYGLLRWQPEIAGQKAFLLMFCAGLPIILGAAYLLHRLVEIPFMRIGKKMSGQSLKSGSYVR